MIHRAGDCVAAGAGGPKSADLTRRVAAVSSDRQPVNEKKNDPVFTFVQLFSLSIQ